MADILLSTKKLRFDSKTLLLSSFNFSHPISTNPVGITSPANMIKGVPYGSLCPTLLSLSIHSSNATNKTTVTPTVRPTVFGRTIF